MSKIPADLIASCGDLFVGGQPPCDATRVARTCGVNLELAEVIAHRYLTQPTLRDGLLNVINMIEEGRPVSASLYAKDLLQLVGD